MIPMMIAIVVAHLVEVAIFAIGFYVVAEGFGAGSLEGSLTGNYRDYLYHSAVSYTSLGLGDVFPTGHLRLLTGVEALTGLLMITWSASFTYLEMTKSWNND